MRSDGTSFQGWSYTGNAEVPTVILFPQLKYHFVLICKIYGLGLF